MVAISAADVEPGAVCRERRGQAGQQNQRKAQLALGGEGSGGQQHGRGRQRDAQLLHEYPGEEQQVAVGQEDMSRQFHKADFACRE